ncbi:hypothetical protein BC834DRAFT_866802 [Gloeopeniophorella convolvens]|nr:hypothetical protein BC834DRAFT_866802 [Gloeopeniophorella convolvens]
MQSTGGRDLTGPYERKSMITSDTDEGIVTSESSASESVDSGFGLCVLSTEGSASEEDYELRRVETRSMDFKRGVVVSLVGLSAAEGDGDTKKPQGFYDLPRVVVSASLSMESETFSPHMNHASRISMATIDLGDFPKPPIISDTLRSISTSLFSEIESSLGGMLKRNLGVSGRRVSSAPQLTA